MSIFRDFFVKEKPVFTGITRGIGGFGFGGGGGGEATGGSDSFTIYLWGAAADNQPTAPYGEIKAGFTEVTIEKSSIPASYTRFEVIVGQEGLTSDSTSARFGGGGGAAPQSGTPGGGGSFIFLSSPGSTNVFTDPGTSLGVPVPAADTRCVAAAGGSGGRDTVDDSAAPGGGGLTLAPGFSYAPEITKVDRTNGSPGYIGQTGVPGSPYSSGGGGGGFAAGMTQYDYPGWGGSGFAGSNDVDQVQPFTGPSPVNSLVYTLGNTLYNSPATNAYTTPTDAAPYRPADAGKPIQHYPQADARGYVVVIDDATGTATEFAYTGTIQFYNFP